MSFALKYSILIFTMSIASSLAQSKNSWKDKLDEDSSTYTYKHKPKSTPRPTPRPLPFKITGPRRLRDRIAIIGAGPSGIHMALALKEKGFRNVKILEKEKYLGGKSWTINYRGAPQEMGTVYLTPDYEPNIIELVEKYVPDDLVELQPASVWLDNLPGPINYTTYVAYFVGKLENTNDPATIIRLLLQAIDKYIRLHLNIFGDYEGEIMPEPTDRVKQLIKGTFEEFLHRNNLIILSPLFHASHTVQGYGHIDEIAALYGLMWNTPNVMLALKGRVLGKTNTGISLLKNGFQNLWKTIVRKENIQIEYNVNIQWMLRTGKGRRRAAVIGAEMSDGTFQRLNFDFVMWSPEMKSSLKYWVNCIPKEQSLFSKTKRTYFTTALMDSRGVVRGKTPIDYWFSNILAKREHSVWAQRDSYASVNGFEGKDYQNGLLPNGTDGLDFRTTVVYAMGNKDPKKSGKNLHTIFRNHFTTIGGRDIKLRHLTTWNYFARYSPEDIADGILWRILEMQGRYGMWYIGSSVSFESVKSVVEYNKMLVRNMKKPKW